MSPKHRFNLTDEQIKDLSQALATRGWYNALELVPLAVCQDLLKQLKIHQAEGNLTRAGIGQGADRQVQAEVRGDSISWLDGAHPLPLENAFQHWLEAFQASLNETMFLGLRSAEMHYAVYPPGALYQKHLDVFQKDSSRVISFVLYLNEAWMPEHGGELMIFREDDPDHLEIKIPPVFSQCAIFLSDRIHHQVNLTNQVRFSVTGWLKKAAPTADSRHF